MVDARPDADMTAPDRAAGGAAEAESVDAADANDVVPDAARMESAADQGKRNKDIHHEILPADIQHPMDG